MAVLTFDLNGTIVCGDDAGGKTPAMMSMLTDLLESYFGILCDETRFRKRSIVN